MSTSTSMTTGHILDQVSHCYRDLSPPRRICNLGHCDLTPGSQEPTGEDRASSDRVSESNSQEEGSASFAGGSCTHGCGPVCDRHGSCLDRLSGRR